jgi:hypothetical protein
MLKQAGVIGDTAVGEGRAPRLILIIKLGCVAFIKPAARHRTLKTLIK